MDFVFGVLVGGLVAWYLRGRFGSVAELKDVMKKYEERMNRD